MRSLWLIAFISLCVFSSNSKATLTLPSLESVGNVFAAGKDISTGAVSKIPELLPLPDPESLFQISKNALAGYPFKFVFSAINKLCSIALSSNSIKPKYTPDVDKMTFLLMTPTKNYTFPLLDAKEIWASPAFDKHIKTVILVTGWTTDLNGTNDAIHTLSNAYFCRGGVNFVVVDTARYVDTLYTWSAFNTEELGYHIGQALVLLSQYVNVSQIHLIGHSLGSHIVGAAGRTFTQKTNISLPRITGLDPANPCFNEGEALTGLQRGDAQFIDVIHSNPGALGKKDSVGDVDFFPDGLNPLPNGCITITCAHSRAWEYFAETVLPGNEYNFMAVKCTSLSNLKAGNCLQNEIPMGYAAPSTAHGNYFLEVNSKFPYGKNSSERNVICNS